MTNLVVIKEASTSLERPKLHKGQMWKQDMIKEGQLVRIHRPSDINKGYIVTRGPFCNDNCLCVTLLSIGGRDPEETFKLADLAVVAYDTNGEWNCDNWLGKF